MKEEVLYNVISILYNSGYNVVAMTSDTGNTNVALWKTLGVSHENPFFIYSKTGQKNHTFADVPHLMKLIKNNFIGHGFIVNEGIIVDFNK